MNKVSILVFGSLFLLSFVFAATPWSQLARADVSGYVDSATVGLQMVER
jgi:hypothetical protein